MKILLLILQIGLAAHTAIGAFWKFSNSGYLDPMFPMISHTGWVIICVLELVASVLLVVPLFKKSLCKLAVAGAGAVILEMLGFTVIYLSSGTANYGPIYYWLVVAAVAGFVAYKKAAPKIS